LSRVNFVGSVGSVDSVGSVGSVGSGGSGGPPGVWCVVHEWGLGRGTCDPRCV
jgi:hypothetical protein